MLAIDIPGFADLRLEHLVLDFNGTLAVDGRLLRGVAPVLRELSAALQIHVLTADTNDRMMLEAVALGIAVMQHEGAAQTTLGHADVVTPGILEALGLLQHPLRLAATLRA